MSRRRPQPKGEALNEFVNRVRSEGATRLAEVQTFEAWVLDHISGYAPDDAPFETGMRLLAHLEREADQYRMLASGPARRQQSGPPPDGVFASPRVVDSGPADSAEPPPWLPISPKE